MRKKFKKSDIPEDAGQVMEVEKTVPDSEFKPGTMYVQKDGTSEGTVVKLLSVSQNGRKVRLENHRAKNMSYMVSIPEFRAHYEQIVSKQQLIDHCGNCIKNRNIACNDGNSVYILKVKDGDVSLYWNGKSWHPSAEKVRTFGESAAKLMADHMEMTPMLKPKLPKCSDIIIEKKGNI